MNTAEAIGKAIGRCAAELPEGTQILITIENGAGWVEAFDTEGNINAVTFDEHDSNFADQIESALIWCKAQG